ncbi:phosphoglycerate kinase [Candidatus Woesearchaeota archaeon]|nr:phosphoglycerate kinase [Candidatus Woesearchaeota archaeon]
MELPLLKDADVKGKRVLVRFDYNVPLKGEKVVDDTRLKESLPTIKYLLEGHAKVIIMSHLGRPRGKAVPEMRLDAVAEHLSELLHKDVEKVNDCVGGEIKAVAESLNEGEILMLENLRFHSEEEANDEGFAKQLAELAEIYVNDAFGVSHRANASVVAITKFLPSYAGLLLQKEVETLSKLIDKAKRPFVAVLGGAKVSDKIGVIRKLAEKADYLLIGGAMMFTFLKSEGKEVGRSLVENEKLEVANSLLNEEVILPVDAVFAETADSSETEVVSVDSMPKDKKGLDIGPKTVEIFSEKISSAKTILWNGPMGVFESEPFSKGTFELGKAITFSGATTILGGGDTIAAMERAGLKEKFTFVSTGGGAMLEFLEGKELPALAALKGKK